MNIDNFIDILRELNAGSVIYGLQDENTEVSIPSHDFKLYHSHHKYYFCAIYSNNYDVIEENLNALEIIASNNIRPHNTYLILFYQIDDFTEEVSKKIIQLEENEFFYKKYVFYYTEEEQKAFNEWFQEQKSKTLVDILKTETSLVSGKLYLDFLLRLAIKVPFLRFEFPKAEFYDPEAIMKNKLNAMTRNRESVSQLYERLSHELLEKEPEEIATSLYNEIMEEVKNEN